MEEFWIYSRWDHIYFISFGQVPRCGYMGSACIHIRFVSDFLVSPLDASLLHRACASYAFKCVFRYQHLKRHWWTSRDVNQCDDSFYALAGLFFSLLLEWNWDGPLESNKQNNVARKCERSNEITNETNCVAFLMLWLLVGFTCEWNDEWNSKVEMEN